MKDPSEQLAIGIFLGFVAVVLIWLGWLFFGHPAPSTAIVTWKGEGKAEIVYNDKTYLTEAGREYWELIEGGQLELVGVGPTMGSLREAYKMGKVQKNFDVKPPVEKN